MRSEMTDRASGPAIVFDDVGCTYLEPEGNGPGYEALERLNLEVADGEFVTVVGPTGCGKSTILNLAAGLLTPTSGTIRVGGEVLRGISPRMGYLFQADSLLPWCSARENVAIGLRYRGVERREAEQRAEDWLGRVGLAGRGDVYPHQLSGGMKKRVSLAQTLILDPEIILMDEPFSALDVQTRLLMENELLEIWAANRKSVLFITHDLDEAILLADRVVVLSAGPATHAMGEFKVDLPRPRDVVELRDDPRFSELHRRIWHSMKDEVHKSYARSRAAPVPARR